MTTNIQGIASDDGIKFFLLDGNNEIPINTTARYLNGNILVRNFQLVPDFPIIPNFQLIFVNDVSTAPLPFTSLNIKIAVQ
jgi:hypothetical protein